MKTYYVQFIWLEGPSGRRKFSAKCVACAFDETDALILAREAAGAPESIKCIYELAEEIKPDSAKVIQR